MTEKKTFTNQLTEISGLNNWVEDFAARHDLGKDNGYRLMLVMEELLSNVIKYAYEDERLHEIEVSLVREGEMVRFMLVDDGKFFDATKHLTKHVVHNDLDQRPVGGLGIHIVQKYCQDLGYQRAQDRNQLSGRLRLVPATAPAPAPGPAPGAPAS